MRPPPSQNGWNEPYVLRPAGSPPDPDEASPTLADRRLEEQICRPAEDAARKLPFPSTLEEMIVEAFALLGESRNHEMRNDVQSLIAMRELEKLRGTAPDLAEAREALIRLRITAKTAVYPRYLVRNAENHGGASDGR